jgi:hypothetical protein
MHPQVVKRGNGLQIWRETVNILNKKSWTDDKGCSSRLGVQQLITVNTQLVTKCYKGLQTWMFLDRPRQQKRDTRFKTWDVVSIGKAH